MRIESSRDVGQLWLTCGAILAACVVITRMLGRGEQVRMTALWIGYGGLAAIGVALILTWGWLGRAGPPSLAIRILLRLGIVTGIVLWVLALVFPFL
jgi:hypothetical protein